MEEINTEGGVLGRELNLVPVDGGAAPCSVARNVDALIRAGAVEAVTGWHISAVREAVAPVIGGRVPYAYTALYEGGEHRPGVFLTGETPDLQLGPALDWFASAVGCGAGRSSATTTCGPAGRPTPRGSTCAGWAARSATRCMCLWAPRTSAGCWRGWSTAAARP